jgi:hypothetical protein
MFIILLSWKIREAPKSNPEGTTVNEGAFLVSKINVTQK